MWLIVNDALAVTDAAETLSVTVVVFWASLTEFVTEKDRDALNELLNDNVMEALCPSGVVLRVGDVVGSSVFV